MDKLDFKSVEDLDKFLDEEYKEEEVDEEEVDEETEEPNVDKEEDEEEVIEVTEDDDIEDDEDEVIEDSKKSKEEYAWGEMRKKNNAFKEQLETYDVMAKNLGYKSGEELIKAYREQQLEKEATEKGVDPKFYKEFDEMKSKLESEQNLRAEEAKRVKIDSFMQSLDKLSSDNGLTDAEKRNVLDMLEDDGYTVDDIISIKSPRRLLEGYMVEKIAERKVQERLNKADKKEFEERKFSKESKDSDDADWKSEIEEEMKQYAIDNGLSYK